jgi:hypothetical protein
MDWNLVASQLKITNGHAARMRFTRFRQQMEGAPRSVRRQTDRRYKRAILKAMQANQGDDGNDNSNSVGTTKQDTATAKLQLEPNCLPFVSETGAYTATMPYVPEVEMKEIKEEKGGVLVVKAEPWEDS